MRLCLRRDGRRVDKHGHDQSCECNDGDERSLFFKLGRARRFALYGLSIMVLDVNDTIFPLSYPCSLSMLRPLPPL